MSVVSGRATKATVTISKEAYIYAKWLLDEAETQDALIKSLEAENKLLTERLDTEKEKNLLLAEIAESRKKEADNFKTANDANKEVIALKDAQIKNNEAEIVLLKKKKTSLIKKTKVFGAGVLVGIGLRSLM